MKGNRNDIIKFSPKATMFIIVFFVLGFLSLIFISRHAARNNVMANYETEIPTTLINGKFGGGRGGIGYKKNHFIMTSAILIENKSGYNKWESNGPIIDLNSEPHTYTLDDLGLPYTISKKANNDTLMVEKEGNTLKFLMRKME